MRDEREKCTKKVGNGFAFRMAQAVIYLILAVIVIIIFVAGVTINGRAHGYFGYLRENGYDRKVNNIRDGIEALEENGYEYEYDTNIRDYRNGNLVFDGDSPYLVCETYNVWDEKVTVYLEFEKDDTENQRVWFVGSETEDRVFVMYYDIEGYLNYVEYDFMGIYFGSVDESILLLIMIAGIVLSAVTVLQLLTVFIGKKSVVANNLCIVMNTLFSLVGAVGLLGLVGGIKGRMTLLFGLRENQSCAVPQSDLNESEIQREVIAETDENAAASAESGQYTAMQVMPVPSDEEYIRPKMSQSAKKKMMIGYIVSYSLLFLLGLLFAVVPPMGSVLSAVGICHEISARAYGVTIGVMWMALTPAIGYYFATISPLELDKKKKILIAAISAVATVVFNVIFFVIINVAEVDGIAIKEYFENSDSWFIPLSMVFASIGITVCYALTLFRINPEKIKEFEPEKEGNGLFEVIKYVFFVIISYVLKLVKLILGFKEKHPEIFIAVATLLLTWLVFFTAFIFAIICITVLVAVIVMYFAGVMNFALSSSSPKKAYTYINDMGCEQTVYSSDGENYYNSDGSFAFAKDNKATKEEEYTYTDAMGYEQTAYSSDGKEFYDAGGKYVGKSDDDGIHIDKK